jgi:hypothetical protein
LWQTLNVLLGRNRKKTELNSEFLKSDGTKVTGTKNINEEFNLYFNSIAAKTQSKLKKPLFDYSDLVPVNNRSILLTPVIHSEIESIVNKLKNKGNSTDLPLKVLKLIKCDISPLLCKLFNISIRNGVYHEIFKVAKILPLFKVGKRNVFENFRPISLLPIFNKILEKLLFARLDSFLSDCQLIHENQFGF